MYVRLDRQCAHCGNVGSAVAAVAGIRRQSEIILESTIFYMEHDSPSPMALCLITTAALALVCGL